MLRTDDAPRRGLRVEEYPGDKAELIASLEAFARDDDILGAEYERLMREHPDEWVACSNGRLFIAPTFFEVHDSLRAAGIDPARTPAMFMETRKLAL